MRANRGKCPEGNVFQGRRVAWCKDGVYLEERPNFTLDPRLHQGVYYVQDASSMFVAYVVEQLTRDKGPLTMLDACAAPGGKTTAAMGSLPAGSMTVANEYVPQRAAVLRENIIKWGCPDVVVTNGDAEAFAKCRDAFDIVLADVPCSGEGMMRKDDVAARQWSPQLVKECADRQWRIVQSLWQTLRPGGCLIYSTCTFNTAENEEMVRRILDEYPDSESVGVSCPAEWGIAPSLDPTLTAYRFIPGKVEGEGLFMSIIRKKGSFDERPATKSSAAKHQCQNWLREPERYVVQQSGDGRINAFAREYEPLLKKMNTTKGLSVIHHGVVLGNLKGKDIVPSQSLALSEAYQRGTFPECEVDKDQALSYLRHESITLPDGTPTGYVLLTYGGMPLGFVKNLGRRANNLYPKGWMIHI